MTFPTIRALPDRDDEANETGAIIITSEREPIAYVYASQSQAAFVRLALAASDMLAVLEWAVEAANVDQYEQCWYADARAAITKAKNAF